MSPAARASAAQAAYVLHRHDWSETSLIVELFTRDWGRVAVAAKGAKRPSSQLRGVLLPFQRIGVTLARAREQEPEIATLKAAEWGGGPILRGDALLPAFYLNELLLKLLARRDPHPLLFDAYAHTLEALAGGDELHVQAALRAFELVLLRESGWLPELGRTTLTRQAVEPGLRYALRAEGGVMADAASDEPALDAAVLQALEAALAQQNLAAVQTACLGALGALKQQLRRVLHYHLGHQELRTRRLLGALARPQAA